MALAKTPTPFTHYRVRRPVYAAHIPAATEYVIEHARYSNAVVPPAKPYWVRYPLTSSVCFSAADTHELVRIVAKEMHRRAQP
jgi:hypothetical protein